MRSFGIWTAALLRFKHSLSRGHCRSIAIVRTMTEIRRQVGSGDLLRRTDCFYFGRVGIAGEDRGDL